MNVNFLTVDEFAERMKISPTTIRRWIRRGTIFACKPGGGKTGSYRIAESELERLHLQSMCERKK